MVLQLIRESLLVTLSLHLLESLDISDSWGHNAIVMSKDSTSKLGRGSRGVPESHGCCGKVLILGDDAARVENIERVLCRDPGTRVITSCGRLPEKGPADLPDLILVDAAGEDGLRVCRFLVNDNEFRRIPVVLLTDSCENMIRGLEAGAVDCMLKTSDVELIRAKVNRLIWWRTAEQGGEDSRQQSRTKIDELESLIQMVAHDLKSPVVAIHGFVGLLERRFSRMAPDRKRDEILGFLSKASKSIQDFLTDLGQLMIYQKIEMESCELSLPELVTEVVDRYAQAMEEKRISLELDLPDCLPLARGDRRRIIQVLDNLVGNAVTHMGDVPEAAISITVFRDGDLLLTRVADNGVGIPIEYHDKIFGRFFRVPGKTVSSGTGLGLAIVKTIVESHGGRVWLHSGPGTGAAFSFTLPMYLERAIGRRERCDEVNAPVQTCEKTISKS